MPGRRAAQAATFAELGDLEILGEWAAVMRELARRGLIWSGKAPLADYAELLVARYYGVEPLRGTNPGYDLVAPEGRRVQVKSRRYAPGSKPSHFGEFSQLEARSFDDLVAVLFEEDFTVRAAYLAPFEFVLERAKPVLGKHRLYISSVVASDDERVVEVGLPQS